MRCTRIVAFALVAVGLAFLWQSAAIAATPAVSTPFAPPLGFQPWTVGWRFQALRDVDVVSLGVWDFNGDGLASSVDVGIWSDSGTSLGSLIVPAGTAGTLDSGYRYADLPAPLSLSAGEFYRIAAPSTSGSLGYMFATSVMESAAIDYDQGYGVTSVNSLTFPTDVGGPGSVFGPNFLYVPEPSTFALALLGLFLASRRRK